LQWLRLDWLSCTAMVQLIMSYLIKKLVILNGTIDYVLILKKVILNGVRSTELPSHSKRLFGLTNGNMQFYKQH
jgi:hypothetical protein